MLSKERTGSSPVLRQLVASLVCFLIWVVYYIGAYRPVTIALSLAAVVLLFTSDVRRLGRWGALLLIGYVVLSGLSLLWAYAKHFFMKQYCKIFASSVFFLFVMLRGKREEGFARNVAAVISCFAATLGLLSVVGASTDLPRYLPKVLGTFTSPYFESGQRMVGLLNNANVLSSILAFGVIFSVALVCGAECRSEKIFYTVCLGINAFSLLLCFSLGALGCFAASIVLYLVFAGEGRGDALGRMIAAAVPSCVFAFISFPLFEKTGFVRALPLLLLAINCAIIYLLQEKAAAPLSKLLDRLPRFSFLVLVAVAVVYLVAALQLSGPYTFGNQLYRSANLAAGEHSLSSETEGDVNVQISSQDREQVMMHTNTMLYDGPAAEAAFTVPEESLITNFTFYAPEGCAIRGATLDGARKLHLKYVLLPDTIARRLQGLWANQNFVQRMVFFSDGMKMFQRKPIFGNGVGYFELGVTSVQDFYYETKYVHNHYIQVLLENGVVGFALYMGALIVMAVALIKKRREALQSPMRFLYPALVGAFVFVLLHSSIELSMSRVCFLALAYAAFALIELFFDDPIPAIAGNAADESPAPAVKGAKGKSRRKAKKPISIPVLIARIAGALFAVLFGLSIAGNIAANNLMNAEYEEPEEYVKAMQTALAIDMYEKNSIKMMFTYIVARDEATPYVPLANQYAEELMEVRSNTVPAYLTYFYLQTSQYDMAIRAAMQGASYSMSDAEIWDGCINMMMQVFVYAPDSPLITEGRTLIPKLMEYRDMWVKRNETAMEALPLNEESLRFFDLIEQLSHCADDPQRIAEIIYG